MSKQMMGHALAKVKGPALKKGIIFVISGPSGSGKTTLVSRLLKYKKFKGRLIRSISLTTRKIRPQEKEGRDYFFVSTVEFRRLLRAKKILEWTRYLGYYYATPRDFIDRAIKEGKSVVLSIDVRGARSIRRMYPKDSVTIFIIPPSIGELKSRILKRCSMGQAEVRKRIFEAKRELIQARKFDFRLENKDLNATGLELTKIVFCKINQGLD